MTREDSLCLELQAERHNHQKDNEHFVAEVKRLRNLVLGACDIFCQLDAPHWAAEFRRALEPKP